MPNCLLYALVGLYIILAVVLDFAREVGLFRSFSPGIRVFIAGVIAAFIVCSTLIVILIANASACR